jgi:hypothetical protein
VVHVHGNRLNWAAQLWGFVSDAGAGKSIFLSCFRSRLYLTHFNHRKTNISKMLSPLWSFPVSTQNFQRLSHCSRFSRFQVFAESKTSTPKSRSTVLSLSNGINARFSLASLVINRRLRRPKRTARANSAFDRINTGFKSRESGNLPNGEAEENNIKINRIRLLYALQRRS